MSDTMSATPNQWMHQFYTNNKQQSLMEGSSSSSFSDSTVITTTTSTYHHPNNIMQSSQDQSILSPKGNVSKPIRRRSRASKRTPTTLLNANTTNFRALVQQFTGCPTTTNLSSSSSLIGVHKGPITLNFQQGTSKNHQIHDQYSNFGNQVQQIGAPIPIVAQEQSDAGYSVDPNHGNIIRPNSISMELSHGLIMDNDFSLHDLTVNAFPNHTYYKNQ